MARRVAVVSALVALAACRAPVAPPTPVACALSVGTGPTADTLTMAVPGPIDPGAAPWARTDAERILFRQLYEPLIEVACDGAVRPGLASAWRPSDGGRAWVFTLRAGAAFWDGVPVTAADVRAAWRVQDTAGVLAPWAGEVASAVAAVDDTTLVVRLDTAYATVPRAFADPGLAVAKHVAGLRAPLGTASYWLDAAVRAPTAAPLPGRPGPGGPVLVLDHIDRDARDALDAGVDVVVTDDPATIAYAADRPDLTSLPLPWDRTYVLVRPWRGGAAPDGAALARDAVRVEARAGGLPDWWAEAARCGVRTAAAEPTPPSADAPIAYARDDLVARGLAERLAGVASDRRAVGYGAAAFAALLASGGAAEAVLALPRVALDPCLALRRLRIEAQAMTGDVLPLVDVRRRLIARGPVSGVYLDWDGVPRWR
ncbi:MAG TPA: ABC transporter substrate-binding protein [Gemmatimonadales bacterium]|nr:ABC transporter substrate-binding protein [Gemmatimonadales bacterium]